MFDNKLTTVDLSDLTLLIKASIHLNQLTSLDISSNPDIDFLQSQSNELDAAVNSQILIDLDTHNLSNGFFTSSIFGGGTLTTAGTTAKANLQAKGWTIVGI